MVDVSGETTQFESAAGSMLARPGPMAWAIQGEHQQRFRLELLHLITVEAGIEVDVSGAMPYAVTIPGTIHSYWVRSGLGMELQTDTDLWTVTTVVNYITDGNATGVGATSYPVLDERQRVGIYRNPEFCAALVVNAVKAHRAAGFRELPTEPQYNIHTGLPFGAVRQDGLTLYA